MKKYLLVLAASISFVFLISFKTYTNGVDDILKELGIPNTEAKTHIIKSILGNCLSFTITNDIKNFNSAKRSAAVTELAHYVKLYLSSPEFAKEYEILREERQPIMPASLAKRIQARTNELTQLLAASEKEYTRASAELKPVYESSIRKYKEMILALENDYDPQHPSHIEGIRTQFEYDMGDYKYRLKKFNNEYPADVNAFLKFRLEDFLINTRGIDFDATLVDVAGTKKFADQRYESKPAVLKYCFRAGREATNAARAFAAQWLKQIS